MELSSSNIYKSLIFREMKPCTFWLQPSKFFPKKFLIFFPKKTHSEKNSYILPKESFSDISGNGTLHFSTQVLKIILQEMETLKKLLIFQEVTFRPQKMKKDTLKKLPIFQEMKHFNTKFKNLLLF